MRLLFFLILVAGLGGGVYPWLNRGMGDSELGSVRVFDRSGGFRPATVRLSRADEPVRVVVEMTVPRPIERSAGHTVLTLTVAHAGNTVLARTLGFANASARETSPQLPERIYREDAGTISPIDDGDYSFVVGTGDVDNVEIDAVDIRLWSGHPIDPRIQPVGFALIAIGFVGLVLSFRRGGPAGPPEPVPRKPRWGRGGSGPP